MIISKSVKLILIFLFIYSGLQFGQSNLENKSDAMIPSAEREFRGAWIATVANINWPSRRDLTTDEQKKEALDLLDLLKENHYNAVIFQARPQCDALYKSDLEPWSYYLTGQQGKAPDPYYDPLEFWIDEAHKRGMELHVWLNPYRAHHVEGGEVSEYSVANTHPDLVVKLKSGYLWLDPSKKETQDYSYDVVMDITKRYDIDGVHFDDYFYPYPSYNDTLDFPDDKSWQNYIDKGGSLSRGDWRRDNINKFIERVYTGIKEIKPDVKFGLSPFGVWRPGNPSSIEGFDQYDNLYADAKLWINEGWVDYWSPQLYWRISSVSQSFPVLLGWWDKQNCKRRHFWPGLNIVRDNNELNNVEVLNQIMITRGMLPDSPGNIQYSVAPLISSPELAGAIKNGPYKKQALIPATPWFKGSPPDSPEVSTDITDNDSLSVTWTAEKEKAFNWVVYFRYGDKWDYCILSGDYSSYKIPMKKVYKGISPEGKRTTRELKLSQIAVSAVDRISNESNPTIIELE